MSELVSTHDGVAIAFWIGLAAVIVAAIVASVLKRRAGLTAIKLAIERGQQLDEAAIRALLGSGAPKNPSGDLFLQGCVWTAFGVGFGVFGLIGFGRMHSIIIGLGGLLFCLGIGLLIASKVLRRAASAAGTNE